MAKSLSKTPAPKKDRIFGSDKNKKGSASSKASAKGIDLNDSIIETLSNKAKEYNEKHPNKRVSVATLKAVMRRGMGAYSTSHRPTITGGAPNSRQAWGFARVNKFLKKKAGQQVKAAYVQDDDLMEKGGFIAPNGKTSNLTPEQYKLVRTPEFKAWFGDWENDPENASKVVDENGEPLVVYHATNNKYNEFSYEKASKGGGAYDNIGFYFTSYKQYKSSSPYGKIIKQVFLNLRNPFVTANGFYKEEASKSLSKNQILKIIGDRKSLEYDKEKLIQRITEETKKYQDHQIFYEVYPIEVQLKWIREAFFLRSSIEDFQKEVIKATKYDGSYIYNADYYVAFLNTQIKLADGTNKTFDMNNPDIRYVDGGETKKSKDAYTIVGVYKSTNELGREESEDLTKEGLIGYRIRYNKMPMEYYGYAPYDITESSLERAKRDVERYNKQAEEEKERKKLKDIENKIKREKQKIIDAQKLEAAKSDDSAKPAYLMTTSEYQDRVVPLLKEYEKFARKNSEYLSDTSYSGFYKVTFEQVLSRGLDGKTTGYYFRSNDENQLIENWNERKFRKYEDQTIPKPTPKDIVEKNSTFFNDLQKFFSDKVIFDSLDSEYKKSNKPEIRRAIEDDTYKKLLENGEITEEQVIKIAEEHGIKVPKRVFSQESNLKKEAKKQMDEILSKIPKMNKDVFDSLYNQLFEDFKDVEKVVFEREKERYEVLIKECIELSKKEGGINEDKLQSSISFWKLIFKESKSIAIYGKDSRGYPTSQYFQKNLELKSDYKPVMDKIILDYAESLKYRFLKSVLENFPKVSKPITNIEKKKIDLGVKGFEGRYRFNFADGSYFDFVTEAIPAAGYNIVAFHYRYLTHLENATLADGTKVKGYYEIMDKFSSESMAHGGQTGQAITCVNCGWHWNTADSEEFDKYICHKCGFDNRTFYDPEPIGKMADGGLIAPNGKPSNLTPEQYKLVRTPEFKAWFGDWENDPENASKVVDENGEPLVVYHGTYVKEKFNNFDFNKADLGFHFGTYEQANDRSRTKIGIKDYKQFIEPFFLNIRKLFVINDAIEFEYPQTYIGDLLERNIITEKDINENGLKGLTIKQSNEIIRNLLVEKYNNVGFKYQNQIEAAGNSYIVCEPNQIKLADGTNTTFDAANPDIRYADGGATDFGKVAKASSRFRPMETIVFDPPLVGLNGAKLISYTWSFGWELSFNKREGEDISVRKSDWTQAEISADTGRDIVHKYTIEMPNGDLKVVSSDSVPILLGYTDRTQKSSFPNLSNAAKTLAKQKLQLSILEAKKKEKDDAISEIIAKGIPEVRVEEGGFRGYKFIIGDSVCYGDDPNNKERLECPKDGYIRNRLIEMGIEPNANYNTYDLKNRIERQERKIKEILNSKTTAEMGIELPSQHDLIKMELGLELFKPSKTIEQIAKEKDVPLDYAEEQLKKGMKTESEHSDNPMVQETIALQHLDEMIDYYEKLEYMENQNKMEKGGVTQFYKEYLDWYKDGVFDKMTIMVSVPNSFSKMSHGENDLILDVFEKKDENVDAKKKLTELLEIVDRNGLDVYLEPIPRLYNIKDKSKRDKITREYLIKYYEKFGFELLPNGFMVRKHNNMEKGGSTTNETYQEQQRRLLELSDNVYRAKKNIANAEDVDEAIQKFYDARNEYNSYEQSILDKEDSERRDRNIDTRIADEKEDKEKYGEYYEYKDLFKKSPALAALQSAKDMVEYVKSQEYIDTLIQEGLNTEKIQERQNQRIRSYEQDVKDLEYYIGSKKSKSKKMEYGGFLKAGGEINPDNKSVKDYFSHGSGDVGGVLVGKRHSEGGIKAVNKSTNQPLEMEGGEVVITRNAVSDNTKREFNGEMLTNREILSKINESGGGVSFADGGDIPETISTSGKEYKYGGKMMKDHEIVSSCGCNHSMAKGGETEKFKVERTKSYDGRDLISVFEYIPNEKGFINVFSLNDKYQQKAVKNNYDLSKDEDVIKFYEKVEKGYLAEGGLVYKKIYNRGGGGYTTIINGMEYSINKQYGKGTWVAQSDDGEYYKEAQTLSDLKYYLENLKKDSKDSYADGGETDYMISKKGNREYPEYVIERTDGSEMISMFFDSEKEAKDYADKKGYKITKKGYNMAEGGETDYHNEIKNHLFPKVEVEVEVEVEPEMDLIPINEHYITADDLGLSDGMPMLAVGTIIYSSGGNDQWEVVSFSDDGVNLVNNPKSPLQSKMEDKHLTFEELIKYFKDKAISIKNISTERELEPAIALVKNKLPQKSFAVGGFIDGDEDEDAKIMQSQFGKSNFK